MKDLRGIIQEFDQYYKEQVQEDLPDLVKREDTLRVSGFPYCGLQHLWRRLHPVDPVVNFGGTFYTGVGTVTHEAIQRWLGHGERMLGQWVCSKPGCTGRLEFSTKKVCPKCGSEMDYVEFEVRAYKHVSGHLDGVYCTQDGRYFLVDYKTSSIKTITSNHKSNALPYGYNVSQITAYCALIELVHDIKISGWVLYYLSRDSPLYVALSTGGLTIDKDKERYLKKMRRWARHYEHVMLRVNRLVDMRVLVEEKPCQNIEQYEAEYKKFSPCPLSVNGVCFNRDVLRQVLTEAWTERPDDWKTRGFPRYLKEFL